MSEIENTIEVEPTKTKVEITTNENGETIETITEEKNSRSSS